jgi:hypothetical protein
LSRAAVQHYEASTLTQLSPQAELHPEAQALPSPRESNASAASKRLQLGLEDLLGDLRYARRSVDLGRLALLSYCEVRRWARMVGDEDLAAQASAMMTRAPHASREEFLAQVDKLIAGLSKAHH